MKKCVGQFHEFASDEARRCLCGTMMRNVKNAALSHAVPANERQVGGDHYKTGGEEHWDRVARLGLDYFQGQITKYVERWKKKNGVQDLEKARHFLDKYLELERAKLLPVDENNCHTLPDGSCIGGTMAGHPPCMHDEKLRAPLELNTTEFMRGACACPCHRGENILHVVACCAGMIQAKSEDDAEPRGTGYVNQD